MYVRIWRIFLLVIMLQKIYIRTRYRTLILRCIPVERTRNSIEINQKILLYWKWISKFILILISDTFVITINWCFIFNIFFNFYMCIYYIFTPISEKCSFNVFCGSWQHRETFLILFQLWKFVCCFFFYYYTNKMKRNGMNVSS